MRMTRTLWQVFGGFSLVFAGLPGPAFADKGDKQMVVLDGKDERVNWNDGDSFRVMEGARKGQKARLLGYNTPEAYGPVHFWGTAHGWDIYRIHTQARDFAKSQKWVCTSSGNADGYGRILVDCPELKKRLVSDGLAHVFAYNEEPDPALVDLMHTAQKDRRGMWQYGVPRGLVTSVHSSDERKGDDDDARGEGNKKSYNRVADTATGKTFAVEHDAVFKACDVFCHMDSCLIYVPFKMRYGDARPGCVKGKEGERNRLEEGKPPAHLTAPLKDR